jgi:imidazolonepropionase-like amidohydrolase
MKPEEAIQAITLNPAKALGIEGRVGSLEVGKDASLFVSDGDILEIRVSKVSVAFIRGKLVTLPNKQEELYERFSRKYGHIK